MWTSAGKQGGILTGEGAENGRCGRWSSVSVQSGFSGGDNPCISCLISIHLTSSLYHFVRVVSFMENNVRLIPFKVLGKSLGRNLMAVWWLSIIGGLCVSIK